MDAVIVDKVTLLASMVVAENRTQAVLRRYISWGGVSAILHEHVLEDGVVVPRNRSVSIEVVDEVVSLHLVSNREKNGCRSITEYVITHKGLTYLAQCQSLAPAK